MPRLPQEALNQHSHRRCVVTDFAHVGAAAQRLCTSNGGMILSDMQVGFAPVDT